ncbi:hypothetical protein BJX68DRAFT_228495 [Aspergillus pseudodeflectus]|uniref:Uncharacterized protein n=1 Tax=Aspergillus pseudodeflectus TaxID=176178 RepID=A0ABR4L1G0_9EURO
MRFQASRCLSAFSPLTSHRQQSQLTMSASQIEEIIPYEGDFSRCMLCGYATCAPYPLWLDTV